MGKFINLNLNPAGKDVSDCVIRAIAKAEGKTWLQVFDELSRQCRKQCNVLLDDAFIENYLSKYPSIYPLSKDKSKKNLTVNQICNMKGTFLVRLFNHLTVVVDGVCYDTWDCRKKMVVKAWKVS